MRTGLRRRVSGRHVRQTQTWSPHTDRREFQTSWKALQSACIESARFRSSLSRKSRRRWAAGQQAASRPGPAVGAMPKSPGRAHTQYEKGWEVPFRCARQPGLPRPAERPVPPSGDPDGAHGQGVRTTGGEASASHRMRNYRLCPVLTPFPSLASSTAGRWPISSGTGHRLRGVRRRARDPLALSEMIEDALDNRGFGDEADHAHLASAGVTHPFSNAGPRRATRASADRACDLVRLSVRCDERYVDVLCVAC